MGLGGAGGSGHGTGGLEELVMGYSIFPLMLAGSERAREGVLVVFF